MLPATEPLVLNTVMIGSHGPAEVITETALLLAWLTVGTVAVVIVAEHTVNIAEAVLKPPNLAVTV